MKYFLQTVDGVYLLLVGTFADIGTYVATPNQINYLYILYIQLCY